MRKLGVALAVVAALGAGALGGYRYAVAHRAGGTVEQASSAKALYHCPMHPSVVSDRPGACPICGMTLVANATSDAASAGVPVAGRVPVTISETGRRLIGARTETVVTMPLSRTIRTVGKVSYDETRMFHVHTKIQGWIEHVFAGAAGDAVQRGDPLLEIYSPELLASQQEYLVALDHRSRAVTSSVPGVREDAERLVDAARKRLVLQDMTEGQIEDLVRTRQAQRTVILYSPLTGTITARNVSHGERIESETSLLDIADLSSVWLQAAIYESDLPFVRAGQPATITLSFLPGRTYRGRVELVSPLVDEPTRTVAARIVLDNRDLALKPGMFADVALSGDLGARLTVPKDAVLRTGERDLVFVSPSADQFDPREVKLGIALADRYEVVSGLKAGERVLAAASFFVDSESRLRSAFQAAGGPTP
ncbi:MAG TPA: efflux RND transporter periplasmic adaptor subunit [Candidatus Polarisedimenticolaceae bacterium]|nr:efflux RND transporter periplasmic adaptor subunit [Candidatus Polarisedimenticolaceae bacterium]